MASCPAPCFLQFAQNGNEHGCNVLNLPVDRVAIKICVSYMQQLRHAPVIPNRTIVGAVIIKQ